MVDNHSFDIVVTQKTHHSCMVGAVMALVVRALPVGLVNYPLLNRTIPDRRHRNLVGFSPTRINQALRSYWNCNNHWLHLSYV